jgi:hypothetical protein
MASRRQLQANRRNARLSSGPKTPEGKATAARNSLKHGLLARNAVLPDEDTQAFLEALAALEAENQPSGPLEHLLLQLLAAAQWRLARLLRIETGLLATRLQDTREREYDDDDDDDDQDDPAPDHDQTPEQEEAQAARDYDEITRLLGLSFHRDTVGAESLSKLSRYENGIRRAFYKALYALQSAQARRTGQAPPRLPK